MQIAGFDLDGIVGLAETTLTTAEIDDVVERFTMVITDAMLDCSVKSSRSVKRRLSCLTEVMLVSFGGQNHSLWMMDE